jgi:hypothetical protein
MVVGEAKMTEPSIEPQKASGGNKVLGMVGTIGGLVVGVAAGRLLGAPFWIPAIAIVIIWALLKKWKVAPNLVPVLAIFLGHTVWIVAGLAILYSMGAPVTESAITTVAELVIVSGLVFWVLKTKSVVALSFVIVFEIVGLASVLLAGTDQKKSLMAYVIMHVVLRTAGIAAAIYAIVRRNQKVALVAT